MMKFKSTQKCENCKGELELILRKYTDSDIEVESYCKNCDTYDGDFYIAIEDLEDFLMSAPYK